MQAAAAIRNMYGTWTTKSAMKVASAMFVPATPKKLEELK